MLPSTTTRRWRRAIAFTLLRVVLGLGILRERGEKKPQPPASARTSKKADDGVYLGRLTQLPRADVLRVWGVLLTEEQAAAAVARRTPVAFAGVLL